MLAYTKALASEAEFAQQAQEDVLLMPCPPMATPAAPGLSGRRVVAAGAFLFVCMLAGGASGNSLRAGSSRSSGAAIKLPEEELIKHLNAITELENTPETAPTTKTPAETKKPNGSDIRPEGSLDPTVSTQKTPMEPKVPKQKPDDKGTTKPEGFSDPTKTQTETKKAKGLKPEEKATTTTTSPDPTR